MQVDSCCFLRVSWTKPSLQCWHLYGLSPVWILSWACILAFCTNPLPQNLHLCSFKSIWIFSCLRREPWERKEKREWKDYKIEFHVCRNMFYLKSGILYCKIYKAALWTLNGSWRERVNSFFELFYCILHTQHPIRERKRMNFINKTFYVKRPILGNKN